MQKHLFKIILLEMTTSIERRGAKDTTFEGSVPLCVHSSLNFIENLHVKGFYRHHIFLMFLIKEIFPWNLCLIENPQPERQRVRKPDSNSSVASSTTSPSLPLLLSLVGMQNWEQVWHSFWASWTLQELKQVEKLPSSAVLPRQRCAVSRAWSSQEGEED